MLLPSLATPRETTCANRGNYFTIEYYKHKNHASICLTSTTAFNGIFLFRRTFFSLYTYALPALTVRAVFNARNIEERSFHTSFEKLLATLSYTLRHSQILVKHKMKWSNRFFCRRDTKKRSNAVLSA